MDKFRVTGPARLEGRIEASGAKNAALPALAATLLTDAPVELSRLPAVRDVLTMIRLLEHLGSTCERPGEGSDSYRLCSDAVEESEAPYELVKTMRASILTLGPLLARTGRARVSLPGGCAIGVRPIDQHLAGLEAMGAEVAIEHGYVEARAERLRGCDFRLSTPSVTGTENLVMAATLAEGSTRLRNCACEPEIDDLVELLGAMGAAIEADGAGTILVEGRDRLHGASHRVVCDRIEAGTYLIGGAMTGGDVTVGGARAEHLVALLSVLDDCGVEVVVGAGEGDELRVVGNGLRSRDVVTAPHPGFPTDLQAQFMALATQASGESVVVETVFENRFQHVPELNRMGADIRVDGSAARVRGGRPLSGANVMATDLRASACLVLAGLCAEGVTVVDRIYHLDRGYVTMESKLHTLGAQVERVS